MGFFTEAGARLPYADVVTDVQGPLTGADQHASESVDVRRTKLVALIKTETAKLSGPGSSEPLARIAAEHDDLCEAMLRSVDAAPSDAVAIAEGLLRFWTITGQRAAGRTWCMRTADASTDAVSRIRFRLYEAQLARDEGDPSAPAALESLVAAAREVRHPPTVGLGLTLIAPIAFTSGRISEAKQMASEALTLLRLAGPTRNVVETVNLLGNAATVEGESHAAFAFYEDALAISREAGMQDLVCKVLLNLGSLSVARSNFARAREYYTEARELAEPLGDAVVRSAATTNLGVIAKAQGDYRTARRLLDDALEMKREMGDTKGTAIVLQGLADLDRFEERYDSAQQLIRESLEACRALGFSIGMISGLETFAALLGHAGDAENGLRMAAAADAARTQTGQRRSTEDTADFDGALGTLRAGVAEDDARRWWDEGLALSLADAVDRVLALPRAG